MDYRDADPAEMLRVRHEQLLSEADDLARRLDRVRQKRPLPVLASVRMASRCDARWEEMHGHEHARRCMRCDRTVFDLSERTPRQAEVLLCAHGVRVGEGECTSLWQRTDGTVMAHDCPVGRRQALEERAERVGHQLLFAALFAAPLGLALLTTPPSYAHGPYRRARMDAASIRRAAELYRAEHPHAACPSLPVLRQSRLVSPATRSVDPWGHPFVIECHGDEVEVSSRALACPRPAE